MSKSIPCKLHRTHGCSECFYPANFAANDVKRFNAIHAGGVGMDAAPKQTAAMDALSNDMRSLLEKAIEIGSRKPASPSVRRSAPAAQDAYGNVNSREDINQLYVRLREQKRSEPVYVYNPND